MRSCVRICSGFLLVVASGAVQPPASWAQSAPPVQTAPITQSVAEPNTLTVTPFLSGAFGTSQNLGSSLGIGVAVGYDLTRNIGFEGEIGHVFDVLGDDANQDSSITNYSANGVYHFDVSRFTPYATFGLGVEHVSRSVKNPDPLAIYAPSATEVAYNFGGGVKYRLNNQLIVRADLRRFQAIDAAPDYWRLYGGLMFSLKR
jgi:opacity protein-like surface antigen